MLIAKIKNYEIFLKIESIYIKSNIPNIFIGNSIKLEIKIEEGEKLRIQNYSGVVISKKNIGLNKIIIVRKIVQGIGVEKCFLIHSPKINLIQIKKFYRIRRAKFYYLRKLFNKINDKNDKITPKK